MTNTDNKNEEKGERIAKLLARAGVGSRRDVERMIAEGRVSLNGKVIETPATLLTTTRGLQVDGKFVARAEGTKVWRYHKPKGLMTTHKDPEGRPTVFEKLPKTIGRVISVGRLDFNTEGLLLLTNDGNLARWMELPKTGWKRQYRVRVHGQVEEERLSALSKGITIEGMKYGGIEATLERQTGSNAWLKVSIREGKNREVRRVMEHLGLQVTRLIRTAYGPFQLGSLEEGKIDEVSEAGLRESVPSDMIEAGRAKITLAEDTKAPRNPARGKSGRPGPKGPGGHDGRKGSPNAKRTMMQKPKGRPGHKGIRKKP